VDAAIDHRNFDWTCNVCGQRRPNDKIDVARHLHVYPSGVEFTQHVRYCNDDTDCAYMAMHHDHVGLALLRCRDEVNELENRPGLAVLIGGVIFGLALGVGWTLIYVNGFGWAF
jgi:hypothetical protein